jgi:hypothetical protein
MKRQVLSCIAAFAVVFAAASFAQDSGEPSEESVLETARQKYQDDQKKEDQEESLAPVQGQESAEAAEPAPAAPKAAPSGEPEAASGGAIYVPVMVSFVPMVSFPFGLFDVSLSGACVGALVHDVNGIAGAGVFNLTHDIRGVAGAGVFNIGHDLRGAEGSGVFNISHDVLGVQGSGVFNIAHRVQGVQGAGVFNMAEDFRGIQASGVFNIAGDLSGLQAAPIVNVAKRVEGVQLGLVNVADEVEGFQLGLVNIARDGVQGPGLYYEPETDWLFAYHQNGSRRLYTVVTAGAPRDDWFSSSDGAVVSAGLGTRIGGRKNEGYLDIEAAACQAYRPLRDSLDQLCAARSESEGDSAFARLASSFSLYPELRVRLGMPLIGKLSLVGGFSTDIDLGDCPNLPESRKAGYLYRDTWFGETFTAYTNWFIGFKI